MQGAAGAAQPKQPPQPAPQSGGTPRPNLTVPQLLAFGAFLLFALLALLASDSATVTSAELEQMGTLTMFLIGALLPSDALIRFGRNLLFQTVDDPDKAAKYAPATTLAQMLGFATYLVVIVLTLFSQVSIDEFTQINEVARVLIIALLPSDAGIRFGRALYYRAGSTPQPGIAQLKKV
ncbi:MAG: hypothetical protein AVDCRST_MAG67-1099 [uncultured Solirubrobacteraceae bacterium]|uniref:Uncharacterized protein n=1 Tax=uncultured Solirubrobacteraceae bacterium TaxID=1162706 RepID=A0A6J4S2H5_9ACTN|nr:MAG: hypothetical protein AVDCRST_MAG67-1099 [uncultured Solirubrobacteraceae bacterium]